MGKPRQHLPGIPVHITARGVGGRDIFLCDNDRRRFLADLLALKKAMPFIIHAFCLMSNHIHLLLEAIEHELSDVMERLLGDHAIRINRRLGRQGHLFQGRFDDVPCRTDSHYKNAVAYIANNPVRAGLVSDAADWAWSSHRELLGLAEPLFVDREHVLEAFGGVDAYRELASRQPGSEVARISNEIIGQAFDPDYFVELSGRDIKSYLDELARTAASSTGLRIEDVIGRSVQRRESTARKQFIRSARAAGVPVTQIARYLGRTPGAITQITKKIACANF